MILNDRTAGILLHITSLPGPHGIGDFGPSAFHFVDWLAGAGQRVWQLLPNNPIGPCNSPYQSVSAFAGSPLMVALESLVERGWLVSVEIPNDGFDSQRVDFARVMPWRIEQLRRACHGFTVHATAQDLNELAAWSEQNASWLDDYALFMALETLHRGQPWWQWDVGVMRREPKALAAARSANAAEIAFWKFVQWCFDVQAAALKRYANERGVSIMGDLPIFIAHHSADCWARPDLYFLDEHFQTTVVAGVPPDAMGPQGQRWGNPLYRWDAMAAEDFAWWSARVRRALAHSDVFRIDHFRGFAGYWEIPGDSPTAMVGRWVPGPGKALFDAIERALGKLPIIAEDLGLITPDVIALRDACGFPGMRILQFAFGGDGDHEFLPHNYTAAAVVYSGTHDNDTAIGWWQAASEHERAFAGSYLNCDAATIHWGMMRAACNSVARMAVFPMQDALGLASEHRMNTPGTLDGNWEWRFGWSAVPSSLAPALATMAAMSGRASMNHFSPTALR
jgi:4-alpha-glucanotransferase